MSLGSTGLHTGHASMMGAAWQEQCLRDHTAAGNSWVHLSARSCRLPVAELSM